MVYKSRIALLIMLLSTLWMRSLNAQSSVANNLSELQESFSKIRDTFILEISDLPNHPEKLEDGSLLADAETVCEKDLKALSNKIEQQKIILKEKGDKIDALEIAKADKTELRAVLATQKKPLVSLQQKVSTFNDAVNELKSNELKSWKVVYDSYNSVSGQEKAAEKLRSSVDDFCTPFPLSKPKTTPTPIPTPTTTPTPSSTPEAKPASKSWLKWNFQTGASVPPSKTQNQPSAYSAPSQQGTDRILSFSEAVNRADQGEAYAQAVVSIYYSLGYRTEKNMGLAAKYAILSAKQKNPLGIYRLGVMRQEGIGGIEQNEAEGKALKEASFQGLNKMKGDPYAITALGIMCFRGEGVQKNMTEAARLYKIAADMGYAPAQYTYSVCLVQGQGVSRNSYEARNYWQLAYNQGYGPALKGIPQP
jgi:hypothetical protein